MISEIISATTLLAYTKWLRDRNLTLIRAKPLRDKETGEDRYVMMYIGRSA